MKIFEVINKQASGRYKTYLAKVRLQQEGYKQIIDTQVMAHDLNAALRLLRAMYGKNNIIGTPRPTGIDRK